MEHVLNVAAIRKRMKHKPIGQRLHHFFKGATSLLTIEEIKELKKVAEAENKKVIEFIDQAILEKKTRKSGNKKTTAPAN